MRHLTKSGEAKLAEAKDLLREAIGMVDGRFAVEEINAAINMIAEVACEEALAAMAEKMNQHVGAYHSHEA